MAADSAQLSLQRLWVEALPEPASVMVTPLGLKSIIRSTIDFLLVRQLAASLWLKLPRGAVWHADVDRYVPYARQLYSFERRPDPGHTTLPWLALPLTAPMLLRGEYLFLVTAPEFFYAFLAVQQPVRPAAKARAEAQSPRRLWLKLYSSCAPILLETLKPALQDLVKQAVSPVNASQVPSTPFPPWAQQVLMHWEQVFPPLSKGMPYHQLEAFLTWQLQCQAKLLGKWQRSSVFGQSSASPALPLSQLPPLREPSGTQPPEVDAVSGTDNFIELANQALLAPLTTIKTALTLLNSPKLRVSVRQQYLAMISRESERQRTLIQRVFELLRLQNQPPANTLEPIQLTTLLPGIVSTYQPLAQERSIRLKYDIPATLPIVGSVEFCLKQAVIHLLENGLQFTPPGGQVWVAARQQSDQTVVITVRDTGGGISPEELPHIFKAFYRGASMSQEPGSGLGLTLVRACLARCGGSVTVASPTGQGALFTVCLPVLNPP
jgi:two-component system phosphate regulon sensor histidine kinase PhoR